MNSHHVKVVTTSGLLLATVLAVASTAPRIAGAGSKGQAVGGGGSNRKQKVAKNTKSESLAVRMLVDAARSAPPEFAADAMIRLVQSGKIAGADRKRELLEEAFRRAADAQQPFKREALPGSEVDTRSGYLSYALDLKLDSLSLRSRAVDAMLLVDKRRARELFGEIPPKLPLPRLTCEDALVYDVGSFYETLGRVATSAFDEQEKKQDAQLYFVTPYVDGITSPTQINPIINVFTALKLEPYQRAALTASFNRALDGIAGDDRSFTLWLGQAQYSSEGVREMVDAAARENIPRNEAAEAFRKYLIRHFGATRCADSYRGERRSASEYVKYLNANLFRNSPISPEEMEPSAVEGTAVTVSYWESPKARRLLDKSRHLRFGDGDVQLALADKQTSRWQQELADYRSELASWSEGDEKSAMDLFHQKSVLLLSLIDIVPTQEARRAVRSDLVAHLNQSGAQRESRVEWYSYVKRLIDGTRPAENGERSEVLQMLRGTTNPTLWLIADVEKLTSSVDSGGSQVRL